MDCKNKYIKKPPVVRTNRRLKKIGMRDKLNILNVILYQLTYICQ